MKSLLTNDQLYKDLKGECEKQAARFSWQKAARETARVYENCRYSLKS